MGLDPRIEGIKGSLGNNNFDGSQTGKREVTNSILNVMKYMWLLDWFVCRVGVCAKVNCYFGGKGQNLNKKDVNMQDRDRDLEDGHLLFWHEITTDLEFLVYS